MTTTTLQDPLFKFSFPSLTDACEYECADDHEDGLHEVCPDDGRESSGHREEAGDPQQDQDGDVDGVLTLDLKFVQNSASHISSNRGMFLMLCCSSPS